MCDLWQEAGIARADTLFWNIVPWYVGTSNNIRPVNNDDIHKSFVYVKELLSLLPNLKVIGLLGKKAQSTKSRITQLTSLSIIDMSHPSARVFNVWPYKKDEMREQLRQIAALIKVD